MNIKDYLDLPMLRAYVASGLITAVRHPSLPLVIFTYSRQAVFENLWDDITIKCRGLIVDASGEIIARPFEKFFNISTANREETWISNLPLTKPQVLEKLDGSLGILYQYEGYTGIASKGSFASDHAYWATGFYQEHHRDSTWPDGYTPVFEMICESVQTHVVHYDTGDHLVLTALVNKDTGAEAPYEDLFYWGTLNKFKVVDIFDKTLGDTLSEDRKNKEGYVLTWDRGPSVPPLKVKVKHETFLALQKIAHAATPKNILEALSGDNPQVVEEWSSETNGEVGAYVRRWTAEFRGQYGHILNHAVQIVRAAEIRYSERKGFAEFFNVKENAFYAPLAFAMLDRKSKEQVAKITWKLVGRQVEGVTDAPVYAAEDDDGEEATA